MSDRPLNSSSRPDPNMTVQPPDMHGTESIGPYRLLERLGEGGMGEVWLAEQTQPVRRQVALKVIKAGMDTRQVVARFEAERQALALMDHPAISRVFDAGATPLGRPYFVMEYVKGEAITAFAARHKLTIEDRIHLLLQVCDGVQHAHQKGIIHRDLKPTNVLVTLRDDHPVPKIIDFGVAKATTQALTDRTLHTELGALIGTPEYMSPEQAEMGGLDIDTRTDVYSLGVILYELLTGTLPFELRALREKGLDEIRRTIRDVDPLRPSTRVSGNAASADSALQSRADTLRRAAQLEGDLDWITMKALEKDRTRRYGSASDLGADLRRHLEDVPVLASPPSTVYRVSKFVRRNRLGVAAAGIVLVLLLAFAATMAIQAGRIAGERDRANREAEAAIQVSNFLVGLFSVSDPSEARGDTLTARQILARGASQLEQSLRDQPAVQARLQSTIGRVSMSLGLYTEAEGQLQHALATQRRVIGNDHLETLATSHSLANLHWYQGRFTEADPLYQEVIERRRRLLGEDHSDTLKAQYDLVSSYTMQKRWDKSEPLARATREAQERTLGPDHPDTLATANEIQVMYFQTGRHADAEPIARRVLEGFRRTLGNTHPETFRAMNNLASVYQATNRLDDAERLYLETIDAKRKVVGEEHPDTAFSESNLAALYINQRRFDSAEPLALAAHRSFSKSQGANASSTQRTVQQIVRLYEGWGKADKVAEWRAKLQTPPSPKP